MDKHYFVELYDYNFWAHRRVWDCVTQISDEQFMQELSYSIGSIYTQCVHVMAVESWWFHFLKTGEVVFPDVESLRSRAAVRAKWDEVEAAVRAYIDGLTPAELERPVRPPFWENDRLPIKAWQAMVQVANHSTDHRSQILAGLNSLGAPTTGQDFLAYLFEKQKGPG